MSRFARRVLRVELESYSDVKVGGEAENGRDAIEQIVALRPALVFLELQMPLLDGFQVIQSLQGEHHPVIILVTAYDMHAVRAFEAGAVDYLVRPVGSARFQKAVEWARRWCRSERESAEHLAKLGGERNRDQSCEQDDQGYRFRFAFGWATLRAHSSPIPVRPGSAKLFAAIGHASEACGPVSPVSGKRRLEVRLPAISTPLVGN